MIFDAVLHAAGASDSDEKESAVAKPFYCIFQEIHISLKKKQNSFYNDKKIIVVHLNSSDFVIDFRHTMCYSFIAFKST